MARAYRKKPVVVEAIQWTGENHFAKTYESSTLTPPNDPLTLEQLRDMEGQPVWVQTPGIEKYGRWVIVAGANIEDKALYCQGDYTCRDYGKIWLAYAYPPAHIDREAWEPCGETCRNTCMTCGHNADELFGDADYCTDCHRYSKWQSNVHKYCERCGRPKTPEAWAELEKRLRG